jgi:type IV secretion system protein VirB10
MTMRDQNEIGNGEAEERGIPGASTRKRTRVKKLWFLLIIVILLAAGTGFAVVTINRFTARKLADKEQANKLQHEHAANPSDTAELSGEQATIKSNEAAAAAAASAAAARNLPPPASLLPNVAGTWRGTPQAGTPTAASSAGMDPIAERRLSGAVSIGAASDAKAAGAAGGPQSTLDALKAAVQLSPPSSGGTATAKKNAFEEQLTPSTIPIGEASLLPDLDYLLRRGTLIPCGVITKVVTTWPGAVTCSVLRDVYSANGHTVLIRAGAQAFGEQRNALLQGQARIFVLWDTIDDGKVEITVNSPAADSLGGSGMEAYVDNHFWQRFGGSLMVSLIGDFGQALANKSVGTGTNQVSFSNSSNATQSTAEDVLKNTIDIPPTAYTNQGAVTNIFVARNVDMQKVYRILKDE